jgi:hypothetical protein
MTKAEQIAARLAAPIKVGDRVDYKVEYTETTHSKVKGKKEPVPTYETKTHTGSGEVTDIVNTKKYGLVYVVFNRHYKSIPHQIELKGIEEIQKDYNFNILKAEWVTPNTNDCGANPFVAELRVDFNSGDIDDLLSKGCYGRRSESFDEPEYKTIQSVAPEDQAIVGKTDGGINFNPFIIDKDGNRQYYQRGLVWTLEQKQLLIDSIFNRIEIGKFIFKYRSWAEIKKQILETGHGYLFDCIDGKQRFHAILEYLQGKFPDKNGVYYSELSDRAKWTFTSYRNMTIGMLAEDATYEEILRTFLTINFTGTPMSKEHIEFVQSIKLK